MMYIPFKKTITTVVMKTMTTMMIDDSRMIVQPVEQLI